MTTSTLKPTLQAALHRVFGTHPGEPFTVAELVDLTLAQGYLYPRACDTPDARAGHTLTALNILLDKGLVEMQELHDTAYWTGAPIQPRGLRLHAPLPGEPAQPPARARERAAAHWATHPAPTAYTRHRAGAVRSLDNPATASIIDMTFRATEDGIAAVRARLARPRRGPRTRARPRAGRAASATAQLRTFVILCLAVVAVLAATVVTAANTPTL